MLVVKIIVVGSQLEGEEGGGGGGGGVGPVVSRMANQERELAEEEKTLFDWCKEGRGNKLQALLSPDNINTKDSQVGSTYIISTEGCSYPCIPVNRFSLNVTSTIIPFPMMSNGVHV